MRFGLLLSIAFGSAVSLNNTCTAGTVTFGTGANSFNMEFVTIGNPGNAPDRTGAPKPVGKVDYTYEIGKFEVSEVMISKYNLSFGNANAQSISTSSRGADKPVTNVSWNEAARFVNWLNTSSGNAAAYKFDTVGVNDNIKLWTPADALDYDPANPFRSKRAKYVLPSTDEWYKAAYYDPNASIYYNYATGSNSASTAVANGTVAGTAVYGQTFEQGPADITDAGGLSPYGVMALGGNMWEWEESSFDQSNSNASLDRGFRGGDYFNTGYGLLSLNRGQRWPTNKDGFIGFRVATNGGSGAGGGDGAVPEPSTMAIFGLGALGMAYRVRRKTNA